MTEDLRMNRTSLMKHLAEDEGEFFICEKNLPEVIGGTRNHRVQRRIPNPAARRSARLQAKQNRLLSPPSSDSQRPPSSQKRKRTALEDICVHEPGLLVQRQLLTEHKRPFLEKEDYNPVAHWVFNKTWPEDFGRKGLEMGDSPAGTKRRSDSTHRSAYIERLEARGVCMKSSALIQESSEILCRELLKRRLTPHHPMPFPPEQLPKVLERVQNANESRIQRDIMPWVVPSAEILHFCGEPGLDYIGDEVNAMWIRCATLGGKIPQPDYVAGLLPSAFSQEQRDKLENYSTPERPFYFTPNLCFPFLMCEAKTGERGLNEANRQNMHSASIAVRAIIELQKAAFGKSNPKMVSDLYGQVLVFTVSHNHNLATIYGHFAVPTENAPEMLTYYREDLVTISLSSKRGADAHVVYDFVRNIYDRFAKDHRKRIIDATTALLQPQPRTAPSFAASFDLNSMRSSLQQDSQEVPPAAGETGSELSNLSASALRLLGQQMELQKEESRQEMEQQRQQMEKQLEKQREESRQEMEQQRQQMEKQMEKQREESRQYMEQQRRQMEEIISLLRKSHE